MKAVRLAVVLIALMSAVACGGDASRVQRPTSVAPGPTCDEGTIPFIGGTTPVGPPRSLTDSLGGYQFDACMQDLHLDEPESPWEAQISVLRYPSSAAAEEVSALIPPMYEGAMMEASPLAIGGASAPGVVSSCGVYPGKPGAEPGPRVCFAGWRSGLTLIFIGFRSRADLAQAKSPDGEVSLTSAISQYPIESPLGETLTP